MHKAAQDCTGLRGALGQAPETDRIGVLCKRIPLRVGAKIIPSRVLMNGVGRLALGI